jgi:predicted MFS family arabinose efflux permease
MASERSVLFLVGAVQFVNILDFMMVMPLGPDFAAALGIPVSAIGQVGGAYTAAAAVSGLLGAFVLDRFDRRTALAVSMAGLVIGTAVGGFATGLGTLLAARVLAGFFGGPATSVAMSIVSDVVPPERRGQAMGKVMGAFSVASVLGVPAGLELARISGWRTPFFAVAGLGLLINVATFFLLPSMRGHLTRSQAHPAFGDLFNRPVVRWSYVVTATVMMSGFLLIPNFSAYIQGNLQYPRENLGILYLAGGAFSFVGLRLLGQLVDRHGPVRIAAVASVLLAGLVAFWFMAYDPAVPIIVLFVSFMLCMSGRNVSYNTLVSKVPLPHERARFMSVQSAVQHFAAAAGAFVSAELLVANADGSLGGVERVALLSIVLMLAAPLAMLAVTRRLAAAPALPA